MRNISAHVGVERRTVSPAFSLDEGPSGGRAGVARTMTSPSFLSSAVKLSGQLQQSFLPPRSVSLRRGLDVWSGLIQTSGFGEVRQLKIFQDTSL